LGCAAAAAAAAPAFFCAFAATSSEEADAEESEEEEDSDSEELLSLLLDSLDEDELEAARLLFSPAAAAAGGGRGFEAASCFAGGGFDAMGAGLTRAAGAGAGEADSSLLVSEASEESEDSSDDELDTEEESLRGPAFATGGAAFFPEGGAAATGFGTGCVLAFTGTAGALPSSLSEDDRESEDDTDDVSESDEAGLGPLTFASGAFSVTAGAFLRSVFELNPDSSTSASALRGKCGRRAK
jgi:hypothetical protein